MKSSRLMLSYVTLLIACFVSSSKGQQNPQNYEPAVAGANPPGWDALGNLYSLLAQQDTVAHPLARKSVRSPSRRLRFGRRSDPNVPLLPPMEDLDELLSLRETRGPVRLRFGRRSLEEAMPHFFPSEDQERDQRAPSMRLRFGRSSDNNMFVIPFEHAKNSKQESEDVEPNTQQ